MEDFTLKEAQSIIGNLRAIVQKLGDEDKGLVRDINLLLNELDKNNINENVGLIKTTKDELESLSNSSAIKLKAILEKINETNNNITKIQKVENEASNSLISNIQLFKGYFDSNNFKNKIVNSVIEDLKKAIDDKVKEKTEHISEKMTKSINEQINTTAERTHILMAKYQELSQNYTEHINDLEKRRVSVNEILQHRIEVFSKEIVKKMEKYESILAENTNKYEAELNKKIRKYEDADLFKELDKRIIAVNRKSKFNLFFAGFFSGIIAFLVFGVLLEKLMKIQMW